MRRNFGVLIITLLAVTLIAIPVVTRAQSAAANNLVTAATPTTASSSATSNSQNEIILEDVKSDDATILSRIVNRKKNSAALTAVVKARLLARCEASQIKLKTAHTLNETAALNRINQYTVWVDNIQSLVDKADAGNINSSVKVDLVALKSKISGLNSMLTTYRQDLTDIATMNCKTDIDGFKASLDAARTDQAAVVASIKDIHTFVASTIRPDLDKLKATVSASSASN